MCWLPAVFLTLAAPVLLQAGGPHIPDWCRNLPRPSYRSLPRVLPDDPWFEVYQVKPGVFAIYEPKQFQEVISYLIVGEKRALLFDTGMGIASIRKVTSTLTKLPVTVLNSHTHADHVGGNSEFSDILGMDLDYTRANARGSTDAYLKDWVKGENICGPLPEHFDADRYSIVPFTITGHVKDGDTIDLGGRMLRVVHTPGHTPDSLCLLDSKNRLLFIGDNYYAGQIYLFVPETDFPAYVRSMARLAELAAQVDTVLPAHNEPIASPSVLQKVLEAAEQVQAGKAKYEIFQDTREYKFDGFSFLMKK